MSIKEALYKKFEDIPTRKGRGGSYMYLRWQDVADRMNEVFGSRWSSEIKYQDVVGRNVIVRVSVCIKDPDTGEFFCQEGFGGAVNDESQEAGVPFKSAYSKALKDACKKWGVGLFLDEGEEGEAGYHASTASPPPGFMGKEFGVPPKAKEESQDAATPLGPTHPAITVETVSAVPPFKEETVVPKKSGGLPVPPLNTKTVEPNSAEVSTSTGGFAPPPQPKTTTVAEKKQVNLGENEKPMMNKATPILPGTGMISDVQKAALFNILRMQGVEYEPLAKEAFEFNKIEKVSIPEPDKLTYEEAVIVVKFGNDKFRKR